MKKGYLLLATLLLAFLSGNAQSPDIQTDSLTYNRHFIGCLDSVPFDFQLFNNGLSTGTWSVSSGNPNLSDDFESGMNNTIWQSFGTSSIITACNVNSGIKGLSMDGGSRFAVTNSFDMTAGDTVRFWAFPGNAGSGGGCENPDANEDLHLEYSLNGGNWTNMGTVFNYNLAAQTYIFTCPVSGLVQFRLAQYNHSGTGFDNFIVDDFVIRPSSSGNFAPNSGSIASGDSTIILGYFSTSGLRTGNYQRLVTIRTNDPVDSILNVNVTINLTLVPDIKTPVSCLTMDSVMMGLSAVDSILIYNDGCDDLSISSYSTTTSDFTVLSSAMTVVEGDSAYVKIRFDSEAPQGLKQDTVSIFSNDTLLKVCLSAFSLPAPNIETDSASYNRYYTGCNDSVPFDFQIINSGLAPLNWNIPPGSQLLSDDFESGFNNTIWQSLGSNNIMQACNVNSGQYGLSIDGTNRIAVTNTFSVFAGDSVQFWAFPGNGLFASGCENPDATEDLHLEYSLNGGSWTSMGLVSNSTVTAQTYSFVCPVSGPVQFRLIQYNYSGNGSDNYIVDDFTIGGNSSGNFNPGLGTVQAGDTAIISGYFNTSGLNTGVYQRRVQLRSNDPVDSVISFLVDLHINGEPSLVVPQTCVDLDSVFFGITNTDSALIYNDGCHDLQISSFATGTSEFSVLSNPDTLAPGDSMYVWLQFAPVAPVGTRYDTLSILSNDSPGKICLTGYSLPAPVIQTDSISYLRHYLGCKDSVPFDFEIINSGLSDLNWNVDGIGFLQMDDFENGTNNSIWQSLGSNNIIQACSVNSGSHGLSMDGTNRFAVTHPLQVSTGDTISFWAFPGNGLANTGCENPDAGEDLFLEYSLNGINWFNIGTIFNTTTVAQVYNFQSPVTGSVQFRLAQPSSSGLGFDNYIVDDFTVSSISSANFTPGAGTTSAGDTTHITGYFNTSGLLTGTYQRTLNISSNDPVDPVISFNVVLEITGVPDIIVPSACLDFDTLFLGLTSQDSVLIYNDGCDDLEISSFATSTSDFSVVSAADTLMPGDSMYISVQFTAGLPVGAKSDTLSIFSNDTVAKICLQAYSEAAPDIQTDSVSYNRHFTGCQDSVPFSFYIINSGLSNLSWNITAGTLQQVDDFESGLNGSIWQSLGSNNIMQACNVNSGSYALSMDGTNRIAVTHAMNVNQGDSVRFWAFPGNGLANTGCEDPDAGEDLFLEYSLNGVNWINMGTVLNTNLAAQVYSFACPVSGSVQFRLSQPVSSGNGFDNFIVDDFTIGNGVNGSFNPSFGNLPAADSILVSGHFITSGLSTGTYQRALTIESNDPLDSSYTVNVTLHIAGIPEISADTTTCLSYVNVLQGTVGQNSVWVRNTGCDTLRITGASNLLPEFSLNNSLPINLTAGDSVEMVVDFSPLTVGTFLDTLEIQNNDRSIFICLDATSAGAPLLSLPGDSVVVTVNDCNIIKNQPYVLSNIGQGPLDYDMEIGTYRNSSKKSYTTSGAITYHTFRNIPPQADTIEITVIHNGDFATFGQRAALWIDNSFYANFFDNNLNMQNDTMVYTISGLAAANYTSGDSITMSLRNTLAVAGVPGSFHQINIRMVKNGNWVALTGATSGTIPANATANRNLLFNSAGLSLGRYETVLSIENSQINNPYVNIPIVMHVISEEVIETSDTCINFSNTFLGDTSTQQLVIYNTGCQSLNVSNILSTNNVFQVTPSSGTIPIGDSLVVDVSFMPTATSTYSASLIITNSDSTQIICLNGLGIAKPIADFFYNEEDPCRGKFLFTDNSQFSPTAWLWDFGDGNAGSGQSVTHFYQKPGTYTVMLRAANTNGVDTTTQVITANPLFVDFAMSYDSTYADTLVSFTDSSLTAASWQWDFGDGGTDTVQNPTHKYQQSGIFTVTLTVTDSRGCQLSTTRDIKIISGIGLDEWLVEDLELKLFPNPGKGQFRLDVRDGTGNLISNLEVVITDMTGKKLLQFAMLNESEKMIDMSTYSSGVYLVQILKGSRPLATRRLILE